MSAHPCVHVPLCAFICVCVCARACPHALQAPRAQAPPGTPGPPASGPQAATPSPNAYALFVKEHMSIVKMAHPKGELLPHAPCEAFGAHVSMIMSRLFTQGGSLRQRAAGHNGPCT